MPAIAEPPAAPQKPAAPIPPAPKPASPDPAPKPKTEAVQKPKSVDPLPDLPNEENEFFQAAQKLSGKKPAEPAPDAQKPTEVKPDAPAKPTEPAKPSDAKVEAPKTEGGRLREELEKTKKELDDHRKRLTDYESKAKDTKPPVEIEALTKQLQAIEKERDEARAETMMLKEGETPEFKAKHQEPYNRAYKDAVTFLKGLDATDGSGNPRKGTADDLHFLFNLPFSAARKAATELFGEDAQYVMGHYLTLHKADTEYTEARQALKANWQQTQEQRTAEQVRQREAVNAGYLKAKEGLTKKHPEWFGDDGSDPDITKAMGEGKRLWEQQPKTFQEHVTKAAAVELAMTAHPRLVYQLGKAKSEIESLTAKLREYEGSEPGTAKRKTEAIDTSKRATTQAERDQALRDTLNNAR